jgi:hypothetical protein
MKAIVLILCLSSLPQTTLFAASRTKRIPAPAQSLAETRPPLNLETCFSPEGHCGMKFAKFLEGAHSLVSALIRAKAEKPNLNLEVRYGVQRGIMHNKFTIRDGETRDAMLETGSFNYTRPASESNNENQIYISVKNVVKAYNDRFETIWEKAKRINLDEFLRQPELPLR